MSATVQRSISYGWTLDYVVGEYAADFDLDRAHELVQAAITQDVQAVVPSAVCAFPDAGTMWVVCDVDDVDRVDLIDWDGQRDERPGPDLDRLVAILAECAL